MAALERVATRVVAGAPVVPVGVGAFLARSGAERRGLAIHEYLAGKSAEVAAAVALSVLGRE